MAKIFPFCGVRPSSALAEQVIAPPYDVLNEQEAREIVSLRPSSFLRVTRSEVDLPEGSDSHSKEAYEKARDNLMLFIENGNMQQDPTNCFYLYTQTWKGRTQRGLMALCETKEYDTGLIKKHELTRPDKEQDRTDHIDILGAQTGLVFLTYRDNDTAIQEAMKTAQSFAADWSVTTDDKVTHQLTVISDEETIVTLQNAFLSAQALYIADGHHRSAAASRVANLRKSAGTSDLFLAGIFPDSELEVMAYNRVVADLNGHSQEEFLSTVAAKFTIENTVQPIPNSRGTYTMYIDGQWQLLTPKPGVVPNDVVGSLDVSVLQDNILAPLLGIDNPRTNKRISFVGGIRGAKALEDAVNSGAAVAFHMFPTGIDQLLAVADANRLMPPKSTWFEPKLRGGVLIHKFS
jgi:uncharacterized protein (DUF1015 family)